MKGSSLCGIPQRGLPLQVINHPFFSPESVSRFSAVIPRYDADRSDRFHDACGSLTTPFYIPLAGQKLPSSLSSPVPRPKPLYAYTEHKDLRYK